MKSGAVGRSVFDFIYDGVAMALLISNAFYSITKPNGHVETYNLLLNNLSNLARTWATIDRVLTSVCGPAVSTYLSLIL